MLHSTSHGRCAGIEREGMLSWVEGILYQPGIQSGSSGDPAPTESQARRTSNLTGRLGALTYAFYNERWAAIRLL